MEDGSGKSDETKKRLMEAAGEVFAREGFHRATVREICRLAGTHVGAVNYHFRDKEALYREVLVYAHRMATKQYPPDLGTTEDAPAEERLRALIRSFLLRIMGDGFPAWHGKLMAHEITEPTEALSHLVENSIRPLYQYLTGIVLELLGEKPAPDGSISRAAHLCAMSVIGQCLHQYFARNIISLLRPGETTPYRIERLADHITRFSLGGIEKNRSGEPS